VTDVAVQIDHVSKKFRLYKERNQSLKSAIMRGRKSVHEDFWALKDISFDINKGETFGLVGDNGSGKSTLLKCMAQILYPDKGSIAMQGRVAALLEVGSGFHPELSGRENIFLNGSILGMAKQEIVKKFDSIVDFSGVSEFIDQPVKNYSSGMYVRLGFSVAIHVDPDILLVDEVLAVGDETFQQKCADKFVEFRREGKTVIIVSHALGTMMTMCDRLAWLNHGELQTVGEPESVVAAYRGAAQ
jgi:ABC-2 type transport system ATP-binding protein